MLLHDVVVTAEGLRATRSRKAKLGLIAGLLESAAPGDARLAACYLAGTMPQGRVGIGWATIRDVEVRPAAEPSLTLEAVDAALEAAGRVSGSGSEERRRELVGCLLERATAGEQEFLVGLLLGELRLGALEGLVADAVAAAAGVPPEEMRRAVMVGGHLGEVTEAAIEGGRNRVRRFRVRLFRAVRPMLARSAAGTAEALEHTGPAAVEFKYDGARIQVHRRGPRVAVYTRNLRDVTGRVPEIVERVRALGVTSCILDGEAILLDAAGRPRPFQETAGRFGTETVASDAVLSPVFFDLLYLDGRDLTGSALLARSTALGALLEPGLLVPRLETEDAGEAAAFLDAALDAGHEGLVLKSLGSTYEAGRRGGAWVKVKPVHTLDLVVLAVEWGHGRRRGLLSNIHLGARDPGTGGFMMVGKTFKGFTDEMLRWQTERFLALERSRERNVVIVSPEQVVEVAFDGVQASTRYPGGVALRFARVRGYRHDKTPQEADTIETIRAIGRGEIRPRLD